MNTPVLNTPVNHPQLQAAPSKALAAFAVETTSSSIPSDVLDRIEEFVLDFAGHASYSSQFVESSPAFLDGVRQMDPAGAGSTVIGQRETYSRMQAVLLNGAFAHSMDFDDTYILGSLHPGAPVIPAALAVAEAGDATGRELLDAISIGYEVVCRVGVALNPEKAYDRGFHITAIAGIFGAVAAAGRLMGLDARQIESAFGIAGSLAAGSMQYLSNGSWNKRLHPGFAGHNALIALSLAQAGVVGADEPIAGRYGLLNGYTDQPRPHLLTQDLGVEWTATDTAIKPYPSCRMAHGAIDACLATRLHVAADQRSKSSLRIEISAKAFDLVGEAVANKIAPRNIVDGQFSVYFQAATAWLDGKANWQSYERMGAADIEDFAKRIKVSVDRDMPNAGARLLVEGRPDLTCEIREPSGEPSAPLSRPRICEKFMSLAECVYGQAHAVQLAGRLLELRNEPSAKALIHSLRLQD